MYSYRAIMYVYVAKKFLDWVRKKTTPTGNVKGR